MLDLIAVPLDCSSLSEQALPYAIRLARLLNARLLLVQAVELPPVLDNPLDAETALIDNAAAYLRRVQSLLRIEAADIEVDTCMEAGSPASLVPSIVEQEKAGLIVMTTHGRSGLMELLMGSVAEGIIHNSKVPVLLVRPQKTDESRSLEEILDQAESYKENFQKWELMLLTLDGSHKAEAILEPATELAVRLHLRVNLLRVVPPLVPFTFGEMSLRAGENMRHESERLRKKACKYLEKIRLNLVEQGLTATSLTVVGDPAEEILKFTSHTTGCLVAMATRAPNRLGRVLLGSVAEEIVRQSNLPVLLVRTESSSHLVIPED
jgi:nucleotide-binding universal stress UspA family protein